MAAPVAEDIYEYLEGYGIDSKVITPKWINKRISSLIIPKILSWTAQSFDGEKEVKEYYSGTGSSLLILNRRPITELVGIEYVSAYDWEVRNEFTVAVIKEEGILKARGIRNNEHVSFTFPRGSNNLIITYKYGYTDYPEDIKEAIIMLGAEQTLKILASRTGGGSSSRNRNYGDRGRYTEIRNDLAREAHSLLKPHMTGVTGS